MLHVSFDHFLSFTLPTNVRYLSTTYYTCRTFRQYLLHFYQMQLNIFTLGHLNLQPIDLKELDAYIITKVGFFWKI